MIRDLQYDIDGKLEVKLKDDNDNNEGPIKEAKDDKGIDDEDDEDDQIKTKEVLSKIRTSMILGTVLSCLIVVITIGTIIYFRKRKKIK